MNKYDQIILTIDGSHANIQLNRPQKLNAYTPDMGDEIIDAYRLANYDNNIKVISFSGNGASFCSGADRDYLSGKKLSRSGLKIGEDEFIQSFVIELAKSHKILIAGLHGSCVGIGITMVLPFDMRIAETNTKISFPFLKLGILPGLASTYFLPSLVGINKSQEIILTNATLSAHQAYEIGLINKVVKKSSINNEINNIVLSFSETHINTLIAAKKAFQPNLEENVQNAIKNERKLFKTLLNR
ncbi:enoyl-CoA hydratase/isomerase family protein [Gammaproteobacteria bacterium]|jgi:2-(1,2-epoxy-1,2-dihydrophenyl)acetyl-CoA isomerase|nr:enoyl-CoA hydratase/isomerase family protein [Gammaproteobacteria bacterium]